MQMDANNTYITTTGNAAVANIAYKTNEVCPIYPITPSSEMSELAAQWMAEGHKNIYGGTPIVFEMQSEAGVAGAMHGALQKGSLSTTFTASQGILLMLPNMFKIAGELTPNVIHVATRSLATHALSVFGDHSDIMAVRNCGYAFLGGASVQESQDFALIAQAATMASRIPFIHFFDGFRTSHETSRIERIPDGVIAQMIDKDAIAQHYHRALNPNRPVLRGTSQGPDVFFQSREACNVWYDACPQIVQNQMDRFARFTGRSYKLFDYVGHPKAKQVIVAMASATETIEETVHALHAEGESIGLIKVRLFRPFSSEHLREALPDSCESIAVLDRCKEPGSLGEPLYMDVLTALDGMRATRATVPKIVGGRYGLSSKELQPGMVKSIFEHLKSGNIEHNFTIGIEDNVTQRSLSYAAMETTIPDTDQILFYGTKSGTNLQSFDRLLQILGKKSFVQGYAEIDYRKSDSRLVGNLRKANHPIRSPYLITQAGIIACESTGFVENDNVLERIQMGGKLIVNTSLDAEQCWDSFSQKVQKQIMFKGIRLFVVDCNSHQKVHFSKDFKISKLHGAVLTLLEHLEIDQECDENTLVMHEVTTSKMTSYQTNVGNELEENMDSFLLKLISGQGGELPVSVFPVDGTYATDTAKEHPRNGIDLFPEWDTDLCTQCGACSMACPQGALRIKACDDDSLEKAPENFKAIKALEADWQSDLLNYTLQVNPDQCTGCNNCVDACPVQSLSLKSKAPVLHSARANWSYFEGIPEFDRTKLNTNKISQQQLQEPLFKYSFGEDGCGEAVYLKLLSQLFGDRMVVANATGASSIFGGALPTTPWSKNEKGRGPAWSNSLFEDNAEFGLGFRLSLDQQQWEATRLLKKLEPLLDSNLVHGILKAKQRSDKEIEDQRQRVETLKLQLRPFPTLEAKRLLRLADSFVKQSVWMIGGDGWAYDIGYGGLDHALASGRNVNILVLDNEVYSNTGGQMSKATPMGASANFAHLGKKKAKKDLGLLAMTYDDVYVASIAIGADQQQALDAILEAESYDGPSLVIAYCHSPAHGIDMTHPSQYHKAAVASGQWLLYRNDPRRATQQLNPFQLDSDAPHMPLQEYLRMEGRFGRLFKKDNALAQEMMEDMQEHIHRRYMRYSTLSQRPGYARTGRVLDPAIFHASY